jgi:hypothetical protein
MLGLRLRFDMPRLVKEYTVHTVGSQVLPILTM